LVSWVEKEWRDYLFLWAIIFFLLIGGNGGMRREKEYLIF